MLFHPLFRATAMASEMASESYPNRKPPLSERHPKGIRNGLKSHHSHSRCSHSQNTTLSEKHPKWIRNDSQPIPKACKETWRKNNVTNSVTFFEDGNGHHSSLWRFTHCQSSLMQNSNSCRCETQNFTHNFMPMKTQPGIRAGQSAFIFKASWYEWEFIGCAWSQSWNA